MGLLDSTVLDWVIGIIFVYLLLAIICTTINEWIAGSRYATPLDREDFHESAETDYKRLLVCFGTAGIARYHH